MAQVQTPLGLLDAPWCGWLDDRPLPLLVQPNKGRSNRQTALTHTSLLEAVGADSLTARLQSRADARAAAQAAGPQAGAGPSGEDEEAQEEAAELAADIKALTRPDPLARAEAEDAAESSLEDRCGGWGRGRSRWGQVAGTAAGMR